MKREKKVNIGKNVFAKVSDEKTLHGFHSIELGRENALDSIFTSHPNSVRHFKKWSLDFIGFETHRS